MDFNSLVSIFTGGVMPFKTNLIGIISLQIFFLIFTKVCLPQSESYLDSLDGKFALQFQISDNFNLTNFQGTTFSGKYHFGCRSAVRVGFSVNLNNSDAKNNITLLDTSLTLSSDANQYVFGMIFRTQYIHYIPGMYDIMFFIGGGPFVGFNSGTNEISYTNNDPTNRKETLDDFTVGLDLLVGVEWMFTKNMSLSAEYGIRFLYNSYTRKLEDDHSISETNIKRYNVDRGDINFGISVYF
jgi:opacity protein-like surface antigen